MSLMILSEYTKRQSWYKEKIWTCKCTGHVNLTHEEAWNSEKQTYSLLKNQFQSVYEKPVLQLVHHSKHFLFGNYSCNLNP